MGAQESFEYNNNYNEYNGYDEYSEFFCIKNMNEKWFGEIGLRKMRNRNKLYCDFNLSEENINGNKFWYKSNILHRDDGPAIEYKNGDNVWYKLGKFHR